MKIKSTKGYLIWKVMVFWTLKVTERAFQWTILQFPKMIQTMAEKLKLNFLKKSGALPIFHHFLICKLLILSLDMPSSIVQQKILFQIWQLSKFSTQLWAIFWPWSQANENSSIVKLLPRLHMTEPDFLCF